jgi:hypothetical protein
MRSHALFLPAVLLACGGQITADHPLTVPLGIEHTAVDAELAKHKFCHKVDGPRADAETYPRCDRPGAEWGESWVRTQYKNGKLVELRRYERFSDDARATERWNQLVAMRAKTTTFDVAEATSALNTKPLEPGTRTVKAFRIDANTVVGVYLLTPRPPDEASILEAVVMIPREAAK